MTTDYRCDVFEAWPTKYIGRMRFDEQIAQAEMVTDETFAPQTAAAVIERIQVQDLSEDELEELPFGAIQLDTTGRILRFNGYESKISGVAKHDAVGKMFFTEIAPCTNVKRILRPLQRRRSPQTSARKVPLPLFLQAQSPGCHDYTFLQ